MLGSGLVERSHRRIVTVRLKQSGRYGFVEGAKGILALPAI